MEFDTNAAGAEEATEGRSSKDVVSNDTIGAAMYKSLVLESTHDVPTKTYDDKDLHGCPMRIGHRMGTPNRHPSKATTWNNKRQRDVRLQQIMEKITLYRLKSSDHLQVAGLSEPLSRRYGEC